MTPAETTIGKPIPMGVIRPSDADRLGLDMPSTEADGDDLATLAAQVAELRAAVARLAKATARSVEAHPVAAVSLVSLALLAFTIVTMPPRRRLWW